MGGLNVNEVSIHETTTERFIERLTEAFLDGDREANAKSAEAANVRRLQEQYRALARGDFGPFTDAMTDDVELDLRGPEAIPINGCWRGLPEVMEAMQRNFGTLAEQQAEILSVVAQGDLVVLFAEERGKVRTTGTAYHIRWVQLFTFRDSKVARVQGVASSLTRTEG